MPTIKNVHSSSAQNLSDKRKIPPPPWFDFTTRLLVAWTCPHRPYNYAHGKDRYVTKTSVPEQKDNTCAVWHLGAGSVSIKSVCEWRKVTISQFFICADHNRQTITNDQSFENTSTWIQSSRNTPNNCLKTAVPQHPTILSPHGEIVLSARLL